MTKCIDVITTTQAAGFYRELFFSMLTVCVTVILIYFVKIFGNIQVSILTMGTDFNLLTYGFLWDTCIKAFRGQEYWNRFSVGSTFLNKSVIFFLIFLVNFLIMVLNFKLESIVNERIANNTNPVWVTQGILKPAILTLGVCSLILFLLLNSAWS